jgi:hypothetical protein
VISRTAIDGISGHERAQPCQSISVPTAVTQLATVHSYSSTLYLLSSIGITILNKVLGQEPVTLSLCPPQIPHGLTCDRTRAFAATGRRLTAWAMARPAILLWAWLTPPGRVLLGTLAVAQLVNCWSALHVARKFITVFTTARRLFLSWAKLIQSTGSHQFLYRLNIILPSAPRSSKLSLYFTFPRHFLI